MASSSEATNYRRAVQELAPQLEDQIEKFIDQAHKSEPLQARKVLYSSDELMDTSDELEVAMGNITFVAGDAAGPPEAPVVPSPKDRANEVIRSSELAKAKMYEVKGKHTSETTNIAAMDNDYQMIDAHIEEGMKRKIIGFEYVDLSKLLTRGHWRDEDQRLELINRNGMTYLAPAERDGNQITSYIKWEQAFWVYSNIITTHYPEKSSELLQYNHMIHTASMSYIWDNIYSYDKEFRYHISRHPTRAWNVILQQAWTMLLKDRLRTDSGSFTKNKQGRRGEPCQRYNKGKCTFGASCKFNHHCSVKKCGKFGHGAHICRLRDSEPEPAPGKEVSTSIQETRK